MKPPDHFEQLWAQAQPENRPPAQELVAKARAWQRRERWEQGLAFGSVSLTVLFMGWMAYYFYPSENALPPLGLALFLIFALLRAWRYLRHLHRRHQRSLKETLSQQRQAALRLQRFIYRVYMPGLTFGVIAGLWLALGRESLGLFLLAAGLTLAWVLFAGWWGARRQARKLRRLDELLSQLEGGGRPSA